MGYTATALQTLRAKGVGRFDAQENRMPDFGLIAATEAMTKGAKALFTPDQLAAFATTFGRSTQVVVTEVENLTVGTSRSCATVQAEGTSALVNLTWGTLSVEFSLPRYQFTYNEIAFETELGRRWKNAQKALGKAYENLIYTLLNTNKSVVYDSSLVGATSDYPLSGDTLQVSTTLRPTFFNDAKSIMKADDFEGLYYVVGSTELESSVMHYDAQKLGSATNLGYQFAGYNFTYSNRIPVTSGSRSSGFIMPEGTIAHAIRHTPEQLANTTIKNGGVEFGTMFAEELGFNIGYMERDECKDISATSGNAAHTAAKVITFKYDFDYMLASAYNSDLATLAGGIKKFDLLA